MAESVLPVARAIENINETTLFIGYGALLYKHDIEQQLGDFAVFPPEAEHTIRSSTVARLGILKFEKKESRPVAEISPCYIRPPDAVKNKI